jgi:hypothetical protein
MQRIEALEPKKLYSTYLVLNYRMILFFWKHDRSKEEANYTLILQRTNSGTNPVGEGSNRGAKGTKTEGQRPSAQTGEGNWNQKMALSRLPPQTKTTEHNSIRPLANRLNNQTGMVPFFQFNISWSPYNGCERFFF